MVDPVSDRISRVPPYSGTAPARRLYFAYGDFTLSVRLSQNLSAIHSLYHLLYVSPRSPTTPVKRVWALPISLATTFGISFDVFSLSYLDGSVHSVSLYLSILFKSVMIESLLSGYPIRLSPDLRICAPPRSFSQLITAFFAGWLQDIHHKPIRRLTILFSLLKKCSFPAPFLRKISSPYFPAFLSSLLFTIREKQATPFQQSFVSFPSLCFSKIISCSVYANKTKAAIHLAVSGPD